MQYTTELVKDIAGELQTGNRCYVHKEKGTLILIPDTEDDLEAITGYSYREERKELKKNARYYFEVVKMPSYEAVKVMESFAAGLTGAEALKNELLSALEQRKPFARFREIIDEAGDYREQWFAWANRKMEEWVMAQLDQIEG